MIVIIYEIYSFAYFLYELKKLIAGFVYKEVVIKYDD